MDEHTHSHIAATQQASAPYNAAATRGETAMSSPITLIEAITQALAWELEHDPAVLVLGEMSASTVAYSAPLPACSSASAASGCWTRRWMKPPSPA